LVHARVSNDDVPLGRSIKSIDTANGTSANEHQPFTRPAELLEDVPVVRERREKATPRVQTGDLAIDRGSGRVHEAMRIVISEPSRSKSLALIASLNEVTTATSSIVDMSSSIVGLLQPT
jgi:hypothetical protein